MKSRALIVVMMLLFISGIAHAQAGGGMSGAGAGGGVITGGSGDINAGISQVTGTHLASPLPLLQGGTATTTGATSSWQGSSATIVRPNTDFIGEGQNAATAVQATEAAVQTIVPFGGTASNLYCSWVTAAQAGGVTFTVDKNAVATALTFTATSGTAGHDNTHSFTFAAGDLLSIKVANANAVNATGIVTCAFQLNG